LGDETVSEYCTDPVPEWTGGMAVQQRMIRAGRCGPNTIASTAEATDA